MGGKRMEGDDRERRRMAREARREGKKPSELGASQRSAAAKRSDTHQERLDLKRQGKVDSVRQTPPEANPGGRDPDTPDRERYPRLNREP